MNDLWRQYGLSASLSPTDERLDVIIKQNAVMIGLLSQLGARGASPPGPRAPGKDNDDKHEFVITEPRDPLEIENRPSQPIITPPRKATVKK